MILKVKNNYTYLKQGNIDLLSHLCSISKDIIYTNVFLLKNKAKSKWHIDSFDGSYNAAKKKARNRGYKYMIPIKFTPKYKKHDNMIKAPVFKQKDIHFFDEKKKRFPTGWLFSKVVKPIKKRGKEVQIIDDREVPNYKPINTELPYELRYYQRKAINRAKEKHRFICNLATGGGKTLTAMGIINEVGLQTLFVVPSLAILNQTYERFKKVFGKDMVGIIGDNNKDIKKITVSTIQSLWKKKKEEDIKNLIKNTKILILDECHHVNMSGKDSKNTWYKIAMKSKAPIRIGLSATPGKKGDIQFQMLKGVTGKVGIKKDLKSLINEEFLVPAKIYIPDINIKNYGHWKTSMKEGIRLNDERNETIASLAKKYKNKGKKVLITVNRIKTQAQELVDLMPNALTVFGGTKTSKRENIFDEFKNSEKGEILISSVIGEGWDAPEAEILIMAQAGKGGNKGRGVIQKIGRVLRKSKYKDNAIIIDFYDKDNSTLQKHSKKRLRAYKRPKAFDIIRDYPEI